MNKGSLQKKNKKSVTFVTLGGGQDWSSLYFSKTCLKCALIINGSKMNFFKKKFSLHFPENRGGQTQVNQMLHFF